MQIVTATILAFGSFGFSGFQEPQVVAEPKRIALTPTIDGRLMANEWDPYSGFQGKESYFQWEPKRVYAASNLSDNEDLVISLDAESDGWLIGRTNYEFRVSIQEGKPVLRSRALDASNPAGPTWIDAPEFLALSTVSFSRASNGMFVECAIDDSGAKLSHSKTGKIGIRLDIVPKAQEFEPYLPRTMTQSQLVLDRGLSVPGSLRWNPDFLSRNVIAGQVMKVRFHFNGNQAMNLLRFEVNAIQNEADAAAKLSYPFPLFDKRGHAAIDFRTPIPIDASPGYRTLRGVVTDVSGKANPISASYRVAPLVELSFNEPQRLKSSTEDRKLRFSYFVLSNSLNRINGEVRVQVTNPWKILTGEVSQIVLYNSYSGQKKTFELLIPAGAKGRYPITLTAKVGDKVFQESSWIQIS